MVVVAHVALSHVQAGQVLERILGIGGVDGLLDLRARDALNGGGYLRGQRGGPAAGHGHRAQGFHRGVCRGLGDLGGLGSLGDLVALGALGDLVMGGRRLCQRRQGNEERGGKGQSKGQGQPQWHAIFPHGKTPEK